METSTMLDSFKVPIAIVFGIMLITFQIIDIYVNILPEIFMFIKWIKSIVPPDLGMFIRWTGSIISLLAATVGNQFKRFFRLLQDFYSGRWYNPLGGSNIVMISSSNHFRELADSPELSLRAVYSDIFGFKYTIAHSEIPLNPNEQASHRYRLFTTTIRNIGVAQLDTLRVYQQARIGPVMDSLLDSHPPSDGWYSISLALLMRNLATGMLGTYFWGNALCSEPDFHIAITDFYIDVIRSATFLPIVPSFAKGTAHKLLTCNGHAINTLFVRLRQVIEVSDSWNEDENLKSMTLLYNLIEQVRGSDYWTTDLLIQAIIGIWFAASHQPWMNLHFVVLELLRRPDYAQALKEEIRTHGDLENVARFPLLDSFLKECVRLNPLDRMAIRRKALSPFQFSGNGPKVPQGAIACVSAWDIMHDPKRYPRPDEFDGYRFVGKRSGSDTRGTTFTDASKDFPIWGLGSRVCPGRWHADMVIKLSVVHILNNYDFNLEKQNARHMWWWESFQLPYESTRISLKRREVPIAERTL